MDNVRNITGAVFVGIGIVLLIASFWFWPLVIYGAALIIIGILLIIDIGKENQIERIGYNKKYKR